MIEKRKNFIENTRKKIQKKKEIIEERKGTKKKRKEKRSIWKNWKDSNSTVPRNKGRTIFKVGKNDGGSLFGWFARVVKKPKLDEDINGKTSGDGREVTSNDDAFRKRPSNVIGWRIELTGERRDGRGEAKAYAFVTWDIDAFTRSQRPRITWKDERFAGAH